MTLALLLTFTLSLALGRIEASDDIEVRYLRNKGEMSSMDNTLLSFLHESSYGRKSVIDSIVDEYTSGNSDKDMDQLFDSAIEAIQFSETDGEPIQVKDHDFLFVGSVGESNILIEILS